MRVYRLLLPLFPLSLVVCCILLSPARAIARVQMECRELPTDWPEEIRALWKDSLTIDVAHGISETTYEIKFKDRDTFEYVWPYILKLKDQGAPITLESGKSYYSRSGQTLAGPGVRILAPPSGRGRTRLREGSWVDIGPPWPEYLFSPEGVLPEYVSLTDESPIDGNQLDPPMWVTWQPDAPIRSSAYRARVDIMLVVDGDIVDLNRVDLPPDAPVVDMRNTRGATKTDDPE